MTTDVQDVALNDAVLKQLGFMDKKLIPSVFNILPTYKSPLGTTYRIVKIDSEVFKDCYTLKSITIPDTVTEIGNSAFENCIALEKIDIPDSVTKIGYRAFANCKSLDSIIIPNSVIDIGKKAFTSCLKLKQFTLPTKYTIFEDDVNEQIDVELKSNPTTKLTDSQIINYIEVILDDEVLKQLGYDVKYEENEFGILKFFKKDGQDVTLFDIPAIYNYNGKIYKITQIDELVFYHCSSLTSVTIPNSVTQIGKMAFSGCQSLASVIIGNSVKKIERSAFNSCSSLVTITIPDSVEEIAEFTFSNCSALTSITIPDSVTQIGYNAFSKVQHIEYHGTATGTPWGAQSVN